MTNPLETLDAFDHMALAAVESATQYLRSCQGGYDSEHVWEYAEIELEKDCQRAKWLCKENGVTAQEMFSKSYKRIGKYIGKIR